MQSDLRGNIQKKDQDYILKLFPAIKKIRDEGLRQKVIRTWYNAWKQSNFLLIEQVHQFEPAREQITYSNVDHTNQVCKVCEKVGRILSEVLNVQLNMEYLLAGALLHDVDKMVIYDSKTGGFTDTGRRVPHAVMGATMALAEGFPEEVVHMISAHSPRFSAVSPRSIEALVIRQIDHIIAASFYFAQGLDMDKLLIESMARKA